MNQQRHPRIGERSLGDGGGHVAVTTDPADEGTVYRAEPIARVERDTPVHETNVIVIDRHTTVAPFKDRLRWGSILGGLLTTIALMVVFTVLGLAIGFSVFGPDSDATHVTRSAAIWSAVSALVAFFLGAWVTGKTAAVENDDNALLNGFMVAAAALFTILFLGGLGLGNLFGLVGNSIGDIARLAAENPQAVRDVGTNVDTDVSGSGIFERAENGAWYTLAGLVVAFAAATLGGWLGHKSRHSHDLHGHVPGDTTS